MKALILNIGNELLQGFTINTNASWLAKKLNSFSVDVDEIRVVKDDVTAITNSLNSMLGKNCDYIFITGGLGPTHDDVTLDPFSAVFDSPQIFNSKKFLDYKESKLERGIKISDSMRSQFIELEGVHNIKNKYGTAQGLYIKHKDIHVFSLPGVPKEFKQMIVDEIFPNYFNKQIKLDNILTFNTCEIYESKLIDLLEPILSDYSKYFEFSFLPDYSGVKFRAKRKLGNKLKDEKESAFVSDVKKILGNFLYSMNNVLLEEEVAKILIEKKMTIAIAESCTGGGISKRLTDVAGSSKYYLGGLIAYSNKIKNKELGISFSMIKKNGSVSKEVCSLMSRSIKEKFKSDIGVSCTGISGPSGGTREKPIGLVYIGVTIGKDTKVEKYQLIDDRLIHREVTSQLALNLVRLVLSK